MGGGGGRFTKESEKTQQRKSAYLETTLISLVILNIVYLGMAHSGPELLSYTNEMKISLLTPINNFINYYFISNQYFIIKAKSNFSLLCKLSLLQPYVEVSKDGNNKTVISDSFKRYHTKFQIYHISTLDKLGVPGKWFQTTHSSTTTLQLPLRGHARGSGQRLMGKYTSQKHSSRL